MEIREEYKKKDFPQNWQVKKLKHLSNMKSGESITAKEINESGAYPCYGGNGLRGYTSRFTHDGEFVLIGRQGALCGNVQYVSGTFFASEHAVVVTPNVDTDVKWLSYKLTDMSLNQYSESSAQPGLSVTKLLELSVAVPSLKAEQQAIATALSNIDGLISSLTKLIDKKKNIKQGAMQELLTGKKRLDGFSGEWSVKKLGEFALVLTGGTPSTKDLSNYGDTYLFVSPVDLGEQKYVANTEKKLSLKGFSLCNKFIKNSILFTCIGSTIGKIGIAKVDLTSNQQISAILPNNNYDTDYLYYMLSLLSNSIKESASEQAVPIINKSTFEQTTIPFPAIQEQNAISTILSEMDTEIEGLQTKLNKYKTIKQGMMQELLTGRNRLVEVVMQ